jgi:two-component sensor histidine kinase
MLLLPAILVSGLIGGIKIGLGMAAASFLAAWVWFFPPYGTFVLDPRDTVTVLAFYLTASLELYVIRALNLTINNLSMAEKRSVTMFRELQHRVANNIQTVSSVLYQERKKLDRGSTGARALEKAQERLDLMVRVHRSLNNPKMLNLPIGSYLQSLGEDLIRASNTPQVHLTVTAAPVTLDVERLMSLSMIVAEAVTNALKYAFRDRPDGTIVIALGVAGRVCTLTVCDDGPGFPSTRPHASQRSLGRGIMESLVSQLHGKLSIESRPGTTVRVVFPV